VANLNKVILIGRLTRDPESRTFANGGKVTKVGLVVNDRRFNKQSNEWEDEPMFIDCECYNRGENGKLADTVEKYCHKGSQVAVEGKLQLDQWEDKTSGGKRSKHKIVAFAVQLLDKKADRPANDDADSSDVPAQGNSGDDNSSDIPF
jgi:single-strand DNA-binding protein